MPNEVKAVRDYIANWTCQVYEGTNYLETLLVAYQLEISITALHQLFAI